MDLSFGTSNFYSDAFRAMGWEAIDIVGNDDAGRALWSREHVGRLLSNHESVLAELRAFRPDAVYVQDVSFFSPAQVQEIKRALGCRVAAQHSCPWGGDERIRAFDVVFT